MTKKTWTAADIYALGVRTDLFTAAEIVLGCGPDKTRELLAKDELPFPTFKVGRRRVVPVAYILRLLGLPEIESLSAEAARPGTLRAVPSSPREVA